MYTIIFLLLLAVALYLAYRGITKKHTSLMVAGVILGLFILFMTWFMGFWGEKLWFDQMGYNDRFWTVWITRIALFCGSFLLGAVIVFVMNTGLPKDVPYLKTGSAFLGGLVSAFFWGGRWELVLRFMKRIDTGLAEPILNKDTGFYLFTLPFLKSLYGELLILSIIPLLAMIFRYRLITMQRASGEVINRPESITRHIYVLGGILLLLLAFGKYLGRFGLLFSEYGIVSGPGWTDVNIRLPMLGVVVILTAAGGILAMIEGFSPAIRKKLSIRMVKDRHSSLYAIAGVVFVIWFLLLAALPSLFQWLKVGPNEITLEKPYIEHNIKFTRSGFHLDNVEKREYKVSDVFSREMLEQNRDLFANIRLWDYRALDAVFKQFQEIRLYYEFHDVDIDRYTIDHNYRQVMVSAREMQPGNLPLQSQTFVNKHFKYTHGYGAVLNLVNEFTPEGLPNLLIRDIPPVSKYENLKIERPEIYYGELPDYYVVVNSTEKEFDYPSGDNNIYNYYKGEGGVPLSNLWRKFLYGYKYGGTQFLLSGYNTRESRIMIHRRIIERVTNLAPFLYFDDDPYIVISGGKLYWMLDAYTASKDYPYSEPFSSFTNSGYLLNNAADQKYNQLGPGFGGKNYVRNSVKVVIDAYNGNTDFYIFDENDPLIQVYDRIFPGMLKKKTEMPPDLKKHTRYPADMLLIQGLVYAKYHMTDPTVFYNQEDLWVRATEKYYDNVQPVEPYYIMWQPPGKDETQFILMLPFTPKDKQVMIGWIAGMCDGENYGRFLAYQFPKEKRVLGTQQVETKIDQDSYLSGQLTLWDQRGSSVIRGNVLAIPISNTVIYVEPIYLKSETSAYPELRLVAVMHNDNLSYAKNFEDALQNLFSGENAPLTGESEESVQPSTSDDLIKEANSAFNDYLKSMEEKDFTRAAEALERLDKALQELEDQ